MELHECIMLYDTWYHRRCYMYYATTLIIVTENPGIDIKIKTAQSRIKLEHAFGTENFLTFDMIFQPKIFVWDAAG